MQKSKTRSLKQIQGLSKLMKKQTKVYAFSKTVPTCINLELNVTFNSAKVWQGPRQGIVCIPSRKAALGAKEPVVLVGPD